MLAEGVDMQVHLFCPAAATARTRRAVPERDRVEVIRLHECHRAEEGSTPTPRRTTARLKLERHADPNQIRDARPLSIHAYHHLQGTCGALPRTSRHGGNVCSRVRGSIPVRRVVDNLPHRLTYTSQSMHYNDRLARFSACEVQFQHDPDKPYQSRRSL